MVEQIMDLLSDQFTLIRFGDIDVAAFEQVAKKRNFPLTVLDIRDNHAATIYEKSLILVRPDQHVAWRGNEINANAALRIIDLVRGG